MKINFSAFQWYRAKFVLRMIQQHPDLKTQLPWVTREVILFGRRFGYTPANTVTVNKPLQSSDTLKDLIKQHMKAEQLKNVTLTYNNKVSDFIEKYDNLTRTYSITSTGPLEIVDVDGANETPNIDQKTKLTQPCSDELVLDVNKIMQSGGMLVNDICHDIQIKLEKEEIVDGKCLIDCLTEIERTFPNLHCVLCRCSLFIITTGALAGNAQLSGRSDTSVVRNKTPGRTN